MAKERGPFIGSLAKKSANRKIRRDPFEMSGIADDPVPELDAFLQRRIQFSDFQFVSNRQECLGSNFLWFPLNRDVIIGRTCRGWVSVLGHVREESRQISADPAIAFSLEAFGESRHREWEEIKLKKKNKAYEMLWSSKTKRLFCDVI
jgi:hypothetical protein